MGEPSYETATDRDREEELRFAVEAIMGDGWRLRLMAGRCAFDAMLEARTEEGVWAPIKAVELKCRKYSLEQIDTMGGLFFPERKMLSMERSSAGYGLVESPVVIWQFSCGAIRSMNTDVIRSVGRWTAEFSDSHAREGNLYDTERGWIIPVHKLKELSGQTR